MRWGNDDRKICKSLRCQSDTILLAIKLIRGPEGPAAHVLHAGVNPHHGPGALYFSNYFLIFSSIYFTLRELTMPMRELEAKELFLFSAPDTDMNISVFLS